MLVLWLATGVLSGSAEAPSPVIIQGDDAGGWQRSYYQRQIDEVEEHLKGIVKAAQKAVRPEARKRAVRAAESHVEAIRSYRVDLGPVLSAIDLALADMRRANADAAALSNVIAEYVREAERARLAAFRRKKRDEEALLAIMLH